MNLEQLRKELEIDEGVKYAIYLDHLGLPTFGIGHLIIDSDVENGSPVGTEVSESRVQQAFEADVLSVILLVWAKHIILKLTNKPINIFFIIFPLDISTIFIYTFNYGEPQ